ncbi:MAG: Presenilin [Promethearchaeota archaeon]|nr:MAG: Presenilin [Candidatus Lokiarchaeota archaeon]
MSNLSKSDEKNQNESDLAINKNEESEKESIEKDAIPHFFPTFRVKRNLYPIPILFAVFLAGILAYLTYIVAGIQVDGGYIPEDEFGALAGLLNGIIFTVMAGVSAFVIIYLIKKKGINVLKYIFGFSFAFLSYFLTIFFGEVILALSFNNLPGTNFYIVLSNTIYITMLIGTGILTILMIYKYFTSTSLYLKNFVVLYIGLMTGAQLGVIMPWWTSLAILIGLSLWDMFAVLYKKGPIRQMVDLASEDIEELAEEKDLTEEEIQEKIESGELEYDTSKLEIGIGDIAFYSMLTSTALIFSNTLFNLPVIQSIFVMIFTAIAIIFGTGITIAGLKRNKLLPGLPISIFLGIGTMLLSIFVFSLI